MNHNPALLVLTSDADLRRRAMAWKPDGVDVVFYEDPAEALSAARKLDVWLFLVDGRAGVPSQGLLRRARSVPSNPEVLLLLARDADIPSHIALEDLHVARGDPQSLREPVQRLLRLQTVRQRSGLVGSTPAMRALLNTIVQVAPLDVPVLIQGESGTGKEMVARALHEGSGRHDRAFVSVNVGSLAESLLESELFGHEKGAFTGAVARREGVFERANAGTLFLDEVGEMSPAMQVKVLRVLETSEYLRVGGMQTLRTDVRLLAATHRNLEGEMAAGRFREDLYYRLKVVKIEIPPLRERVEDIPALVNTFLTELNAKHGLSLKGMTREAMDRFMRYAWPGNVRQLRNVVSSMAVLSQGEYLGVDDLPDDLVGSHPGPSVPIPYPAVGANGTDAMLTSTLLAILADVRQILQRMDRIESRVDAAGMRQASEVAAWEGSTSEAEFTPLGSEAPRDLASAERAMIEDALRLTHGNRRKAAIRLGISERTLYRKLKTYGLR